MDGSFPPTLPIFLAVACALALAVGLLIVARIFNPDRPGAVERMPYESGMDPIHDTRRRFDVRFYLLAVAFLVFDVELLFLYPWAVAWGGGPEAKGIAHGWETVDGAADAPQSATANPRPSGFQNQIAKNASPRADCFPSSRRVFVGAMTFLLLLTLGFIYDWRKGVFRWR